MKSWHKVLVLIGTALIAILIYKKVASVSTLVNKIPGFA
jgi:hypothetical protein